MMIDIFLPPGVQMRLSERLGMIPRQTTVGTAKAIEQLWRTRNRCEESEVDAIDKRMENLIVSRILAQRGFVPRRIVEQHNLHGDGYHRHTVFVMPSKSRHDFWRSVTNVRCPCCPAGKIRWHEAGYVPGYRI